MYAAARFQRIFRRLTNRDRKPEFAQQAWANMHAVKKGWLENYWKQNTRREYLARNICALNSISSVIEMGCNVGSNLYAIHKINPDIRLAGVDINELAVHYGLQKFCAEDIQADLKTMSLYDIDRIPEKSYDVVFTSAVLMHLPPDNLNTILKNFKRIACKFVIHLELHAFSKSEYLYYKKLAQKKFRDRWCRDYFMAYNEIFEESKIQICQVPPSLARLDISHGDIKVDYVISFPPQSLFFNQKNAKLY